MLSTISELWVNIFAFMTVSQKATLELSLASQLIFTLFSGMIRPFPDTHEFYHYISYLSPMKYSFEGIVIEFLDQNTKSQFDKYGSLNALYGMDSMPYSKNKFLSWIALGSYLTALFLVFLLTARRSL